MAECIWSDGAWDPGPPADGDTINLSFSSLPPPTGADLPGPGTYHILLDDQMQDPPYIRAEHYIGQGRIGTITLLNDSGLAVGVNFEEADLIGEAANVLEIAGRVAGDVNLGLTAALKIAAGRRLTGTVTASADCTISMGLGAAITGLVDAGGNAVTWEIAAGSPPPCLIITASCSLDLGATDLSGLAIILAAEVLLTTDLTCLSLDIIELLDADGQTVSLAGRGYIGGAGVIANAAIDPPLYAAEGLRDGGGNSGITWQPPDGTGTTTSTGG